ncbi:ABC transporter ATP-binding protein [Terriglobus sp. TAA 43]|uniref:ABC transporter ATP-binding protein n=1 Tax=Terriglobus sp. TAA 43 TaxID=278961 RepID=UPI000645F85A|nr:ABC transporter ATP-binding protein [Terriglobus sp. TAA 43]
MGSMGSLGGGRHLHNAERTARNPSRTISAEMTKKKKLPPMKRVMPEVMKLVKPRLPLLIFSFFVLIINRVCGLVLPASTRFLIDNVMRQHEMSLLPKIVAAVAGATILQGITTYALTQMLSKEGQKLIAEMRVRVQAHIGKLPVKYYDENRSGTLVARIMTDVEGVRNIIGTGLVDFVGALLTASLSFIYLMRLSTGMTLLSFAILGMFGLVIFRAFKVIRPIFRERGAINAEVTGRLTESLGGVRVVKGYHAEAAEAKVFAAGAERLLKNVISSLTAQSVMALTSQVMMGIVGALIMYLGARQVAAGHLTTGGYVTYTMFLTFMIAPLMSMVNIGTQLTEALAGLDRTAEIMNEHDEDAAPRRSVELATITGDVIFQDVHFEYEPGKEVLHGITFEAEPGSVTALVGSSGSGKSTIISLVCAFHDATTGQVLVDGVDLSTVRLDSFRSQLGVVLQETFLFDGTIRDNVKFSRPEATEEEFLEACRIARVDEFAENFAEGYETIVGERGVKLSGGQRQRLSIARAILADPRILILDEATSSLDSESEAMIQQGLNHLMQGRTTFVIAHRLSTIRNANQILVIEAGRIVERGTHAELYLLHGRYRELYDRQHGLEQNLFLAPGEEPVPVE